MNVKKMHEKRQKLGVASRNNKQKYIDSKTGLYAQTYIEERTCPVCNADDFVKMFVVRGGRYVKCRNCEMVYLNPVFKDTELTKFYKHNHTVQAEVVEEDGAFYSQVYKKGLKRIQDATVGTGTLLDIGCSSGCFLDIVKQHGWTGFGIELNQAESVMAQAKGFEVFSDIASVTKTVDVITLWDVYEHIKDGKKFIAQCKELLNKNGLLFFQVPVADSLAAKIMHEHCNMFDGMEHVNLYSKRSLDVLSQVCGFEILSYETIISELHVMNNYLNYEDPYFGSFEHNGKLFELLDEQMIVKMGYGYKAQVLIKFL